MFARKKKEKRKGSRKCGNKDKRKSSRKSGI
jgi:hypothetical protein